MSKKWLIAFMSLALVMALGLAACDDDDDGPVDSNGTIDIYGNWTVLTGADMSLMLFHDNDIYEFLFAHDLGFYSISSDVFLATETQIMVGTPEYFDVAVDRDTRQQEQSQMPMFGVWNYHVRNDTLTLWKPDDTILAVANPNAPTAAQWMPSASLTGLLDPPHQRVADMAFHDGSLWYGNARATDYIFRIDPADGGITDSIYSSRSAYALEWEDTSLWISSNGYDRIYNIDTASGAVRRTIMGIGAWAQGIAYTGANLYIGCNNGQSVYQCNPTTQAVLDSVRLPMSPGGMTFDGFSLWLCARGNVYRMAPQVTKTAGIPSPEQEVNKSYRLPGYSVFGLAWDGDALWAAAVRDSDQYAVIGKLIIPPDIVEN